MRLSRGELTGKRSSADYKSEISVLLQGERLSEQTLLAGKEVKGVGGLCSCTLLEQNSSPWKK